MVPFATTLLSARQRVDSGPLRKWLARLNTALELRGIDPERRMRWTGALTPFLDRHALNPEMLRPGQVQSFIEEQVESGSCSAHRLIDLIQALSFFYESVVEKRDLAGEAGHPFDRPGGDEAGAETLVFRRQTPDARGGRGRPLSF